MKQQRFVKLHEREWDSLQSWLSALDRQAKRTLRQEQALDFPASYRRVCHHLALARGRGYSHEITDRLQQRLGLDRVLANVLEVADGRLTGRIVGDIVDAVAKARAFRALADDLRNRDGLAVAIGDGANDLPMLDEADVSVAYRAKPAVRARAMHAIDHCGLDAALNLFA